MLDVFQLLIALRAAKKGALSGSSDALFECLD
jgi:hypothetical protein